MGQAQRSEMPSQPPPVTNARNRILVVDDDAASRDLCKSFLETEGYIVETSDRAKKAMALLSLKRFDLIITDLTMPEMDGIGCIEAMMEVNSSIKILVVSALSDKATGIEAISKGARGFLCKPFTDADLRGALEKLLSSKDRS